MLASALAQAEELPGRIADTAEMIARMAAHREHLEGCLARARYEAATDRRFGRDFSARRARALAEALDEEIVETDAMLVEVDRVTRRLRREIRSVGHRLELCGSLVAELPPCPERTRALALVEAARAGLDALRHGSSGGATASALYTFIRVEAKQTGHAR